MSAAPKLPLFRDDPEPRVSRLTLPEPPSSNRWWRMVVIKGSARMLLSKEARDYKAKVAQLGDRQCISTGSVRVSIEWYRERRAGDLDKRLGIVMDAVQGVLYANDAQVDEIVAKRLYDPMNPRLVIVVEAI